MRTRPIVNIEMSHSHRQVWNEQEAEEAEEAEEEEEEEKEEEQ